MKYGMDIQTDNIIREEIISDLFWSEDFTLTVSSVNDAPVLLQPIECLEILEDSVAAAMVLNTTFEEVESNIYGMDIQTDNIIGEEIISDLFWSEDFTLTVSSVNDAPVLLQPIECLEILEDSVAAAMVLNTTFENRVYSKSNFL